MGKRKGTFIALLICLFLLGSMLGVTFASSGNWVEVKNYAGAGGIGSVPTFTVDHVDWRIKWEIEPGNGTQRKSFLVYIYLQLADSGLNKYNILA